MSGAETSLWPAAIEAAEMIEPGMVVGLGTGRAAAMFVRALAQRIREGLRVRGVPTSRRTGELATELGYTGAKDGSAEMNIWLHRRVMDELERNGGIVPDSLKN